MRSRGAYVFCKRGPARYKSLNLRLRLITLTAAITGFDEMGSQVGEDGAVGSDNSLLQRCLTGLQVCLSAQCEQAIEI
jgi:hypothetical protein